MPGTPPSRTLGRARDQAAAPVTDWAEDRWDDVAVVADRDVVRFSDREIEAMLAAVAVGVVGAAVLVGWWSLRRRT